MESINSTHQNSILGKGSKSHGILHCGGGGDPPLPQNKILFYKKKWKIKSTLKCSITWEKNKYKILPNYGKILGLCLGITGIIQNVFQGDQTTTQNKIEKFLEKNQLFSSGGGRGCTPP